jgi:hypothetical protein
VRRVRFSIESASTARGRAQKGRPSPKIVRRRTVLGR